MMHRPLRAALCAIAAIAAPAAAAQDLPRTPWHLANIWWDFRAPDASFDHFESIEVDVTIDRDLPDTVNLYIAPIGYATLNGIGFYGGFQTNINGFLTPDDRERLHYGHGVIFSRWDSDALTPSHLRRFDDGLQETAGYEGEFASIRRPLAWTAGTYTYRLTKGETVEIEGDAQPSTWIECSVTNHQTGETTPIGALRFEGTDFTFGGLNSAFVEVYATSQIRRSAIPPVVVTFGYPRINGNAMPLRNASAYYPNEGSQASPDAAVITANGSDVVVTVTDIFERDETTRRHPLELTTPTE